MLADRIKVGVLLILLLICAYTGIMPSPEANKTTGGTGGPQVG